VTVSWDAIAGREYSYLVLVVDNERLRKFLEQGLFVEVHPAICQRVVAAIVAFEEDIHLKIPIEGQEQGDEMPSNQDESGEVRSKA
jgi:hypothetical protein